MLLNYSTFITLVLFFVLFNNTYAVVDLNNIVHEIPSELIVGSGVAVIDQVINKSKLKDNSLLSLGLRIIYLIGKYFLAKKK